MPNGRGPLVNAGGQVSPAEFRRLLAASQSLLGRFTEPELFHSQTVDLATAPTVNVPQPLNIDRPLESIDISLRFRVGVTVAPYTAVSPEAPQNILQRITLTGIHRAYGNIVPWSMSGATWYALSHIFQGEPSWILINGALAAGPGIPFNSPFAGAVGNYDIQLYWHFPVGPAMGIDQNLKRQITSFLYMPADWSDSLRLQLTFGDRSALGDPTGATVAFTAFESGAGLPGLEVHLNYALLGPFANRMPSGITMRQEQTLTTFTALATRSRLTTLQKQITTNLFVKSGVTETTGQTAGVTTFESLSDTQLNRTQIVVDNKPVRNNSNNRMAKSYIARMFGRIVPQGYFPFTFVDGQNALLAYRGDGISGGSTFEVITDVDTASADNRQTVTQEMVIGGPFPGLR